VVLQYVVDITALPQFITGLLPCVMGFYGTVDYILTVFKIL
jgi:hypothetical protein